MKNSFSLKNQIYNGLMEKNFKTIIIEKKKETY